MAKPSDGNKRRQTGARIDDDLVVEVRVLAVRQRRRFNELLEEALHDLLKKYGSAKKKGSG
jgi:hypothetical protein